MNRNPHQDGLTNAPRCSYQSKRTHQPCRAPAIRGSNPPACRSHAGKPLATVRAEAAVREEVTRWQLGNTHTDPGELLLRLVTQSAIRADMYANELARVVEEAGDLRKGLTGTTWTVTADGDRVKTGEYIRALTMLEAQERDRAASFAAKAVAAGLAERQTRVAERQARLAAEFVQAVLRDLGIPAPQAQTAIERHLRLIHPTPL